MRLFFIIILFSTTFSFSQKKLYGGVHHYLGLNANTISGVGPSYRFSFKGFSTQASFSGYKAGSRIKYNAGISIMHNIDYFKKGQLIFGLSARLKRLRDTGFDYIDGSLSLQEEWRSQLNTGFHFDYMHKISKRILLNFSLGYGLYNLLGGVKRSNVSNSYADNIFERLINFRLGNFGTFPTIGLALYYQLN
jgi:hypothetical protein